MSGWAWVDIILGLLALCVFAVDREHCRQREAFGQWFKAKHLAEFRSFIDYTMTPGPLAKALGLGLTGPQWFEAADEVDRGALGSAAKRKARNR